MAWIEITARRSRTGRTYRDTATGQRRMVQYMGTHLHYPTGGPDSGSLDGVVDMTPVRVNNAQFDGWRITAGDWHYALGKDLANHGSQDGWMGFGGRQGQHWLKFRLTRIGYLHWPTRAWDDIGGTPTYNRANLSGQTQALAVGPGGDTVNVMSSATWANVWTTPGGGSLSVTWRAEGRQLKEDVVINAAARAWITANRPPSTPASETWLGFMFRVDWSDIPRAVRDGILQNIGQGGDFSDDGAPIELQDAQERVLAFLPVDVAWATSDVTKTIQLRKRFWRDPDGNDYLIVGAKVSDLATLPAGDVVFDPTTTIQPDATAGIDTMAIDITPTTNYGTNAVLAVGDGSGAALSAYRTLIKFDLSTIPAGARVVDAGIFLNEYSAADTAGVGSWAVDARRLLRNWVEAQATWNIYATASNWTTAGAGSLGNDVDADISATVTLDGTAAAGFVEWSGATLIDDVQGFVDGTYSNYGWGLAALTAERQGTAAQFSANYFRSSDYGTAGDRPKIEVTYAFSLPLVNGGLVNTGLVNGGLVS